MPKLRYLTMTALVLSLTACAGRAPNPAPTVRVTDAMLDCNAIQVEIDTNARTQKDLSNEKGGKFVQNFAAGFLGVFFFPAFFLADVQGTQDIESRALDGRNAYLSTLALQRCPALAPQPVVAGKMGWQGATP